MSRLNITPSPDFNRIRNTLLLKEKPDHLPLMDFFVDWSLMEWILDRPIKLVEYKAGDKVFQHPAAKDQCEFFATAGYDYVMARAMYDFNLGSVTDHEDSRQIEGVGVIATREILDSRQWPWQKQDGFCVENIKDLAENCPPNMKLIVQTADIFTHVWEALGFTNFCEALFEDEEFVAEVFRQIGEAVVHISKKAIEAAGDKFGAFWYTDDLAFGTGTFVNPDVYRKYLFPYVKQICDMAHEKDAPVIYHSDGALWSIFEDFYQMGINAIHPLEPNSMDAREVKEKWGDKFCLVGNIDLDLLSRGTPEEVIQYTKANMEKLGYNGGYCVGSSNTLTDYVNPENLKAMIETVLGG